MIVEKQVDKIGPTPSVGQEKVKETIQAKKAKQEVQQPVMRQNKHMKDISPKREIKETTSVDNRIEMTKIIGEPVKSNIFNATMASAKTFEEQKGVGTTS